MKGCPFGSCSHVNRCAAVTTGRRDRDICPVHGGNAERVDHTEGVQNVPFDFDAMSGGCLCEGVSKPYVTGMRIEVDEIA